jgi:3-hydroxyacyl-CoA dehydrogenase/enoyl-CoA hydratase/3-hydroxybutyryl-CoA epimerase
VSETRIGLPEVKIGIFPGLGGSVRLTEKLGGLKAAELILTGRALNARAARSAGIVDEVIGAHQNLRWAARRAILKKRKSRAPGLVAKLSNAAPLRPLVANILRKQVRKKANPEHYPAPYHFLDAWQQHSGDRAAFFEAEARGVGQLMVGDTARNLRRVFHLMERLKAEGKASDFKARRVHVVGAGVMGGDIAAWCALRGLEVTLQDRELQYIEPALARAKKLFKRKLKKPAAVAAAQTRLIADVEGRGAARADVVIEAIFEDPEVKRALFRELEPKLKLGAILATNTSAIPLEVLAEGLADPSRLVGLHFFNPVAQMPLVEVVRGEKSGEEQLAAAAAFCRQIDRFPLQVKSSPGFLVNRVLAPYLLRAMVMHGEDTSMEDLDAAAVRFGMPMGPVELADVVGLDVCLKVVDSLGGDEAVVARLKSLVDAGKLGKKSGQGNYLWKDGKPQRDNAASESAAQLDALAERLLAPFFDECRSCLADEVVADADLLDAGIIFGTGFAPFRGGPLHYLAEQNTPASGEGASA